MVTPLNKNTIKLAQILEINKEEAAKLFDVMALSDLAALINALNADNKKVVVQIYSKYKDKIRTLPTSAEIKAYFNDLIQSGESEEEAKVITADFFGIREEDVNALLNEDTEVVFKVTDKDVLKAFKNVEEMQSGGKASGIITELNAWQRREFYGMIPPVVAKVIQGVIDLTPMKTMQAHAKANGYGEPALKEQELSLSEMKNKIIEKLLNDSFSPSKKRKFVRSMADFNKLTFEIKKPGESHWQIITRKKAWEILEHDTAPSSIGPIEVAEIAANGGAELLNGMEMRAN